jgi:hypothetical protein
MHLRLTRIVVPLVLVGALLATAGTALATVGFDPATGTGYVAKADVQAAFGWKEQTFQANARKLSFHFERLTSWTWDCLIDGHLSTLTADEQISQRVDSAVVATAVRKNTMAVTGFDLTGFPAAPSAGSAASCPSGDPSSVHGASTDVLYVDFRSQSEPIWSS